MMENTYCLRVTIAAMVVTGVWLPKSLKNTPYKLLYYIFAIFFQICLLFGIILIQIAYFMTVTDDIGKMVDASLLLLTQLAQVAKVATIWCRKSRIEAIMDVLESQEFNREDPEKKEILVSTAKLAYKVSKSLALWTAFSSIFWCVSPVLTSSLPVNYPKYARGTPEYALMFIYQLVAIVPNAVGDAAEDFLIGGLMILAAGQLEVLCYELNQIGEHLASEEDENTDIDYEKAVACVRYHQQIIRFINELDNIFGLPVFCQFAATCIILCLTVFKMSKSDDITEILLMIFYLVCILSELLLFCYTGNIILIKSQSVADAAYCCCDWTNSSLQTKRALLLIIQRAQRPLTVTAGKKFALSLETFTAILKSSYSFFAVLNSRD